jgi:hypothetical protein
MTWNTLYKVSYVTPGDVLNILIRAKHAINAIRILNLLKCSWAVNRGRRYCAVASVLEGNEGIFLSTDISVYY